MTDSSSNVEFEAVLLVFSSIGLIGSPFALLFVPLFGIFLPYIIGVVSFIVLLYCAIICTHGIKKASIIALVIGILTWLIAISFVSIVLTSG